MVYLQHTVSTYHLVEKAVGGEYGVEFYKLGVTLC